MLAIIFLSCDLSLTRHVFEYMQVRNVAERWLLHVVLNWRLFHIYKGGVFFKLKLEIFLPLYKTVWAQWKFVTVESLKTFFECLRVVYSLFFLILFVSCSWVPSFLSINRCVVSSIFLVYYGSCHFLQSLLNIFIVHRLLMYELIFNIRILIVVKNLDLEKVLFGTILIQIWRLFLFNSFF